MVEKKCSKCKAAKVIVDFTNDASTPSGKRYACRECEKSRTAVYNRKNKERRLQSARIRRALNPEVDRLYTRNYRTNSPWLVMIQNAKKRATKACLPYDLDEHIPEIRDRLSAMKCEMTGITLVSGVGIGGSGKRPYNLPSLDRIRPDLGYVYSNVRIICWGMNAALGTWGEEKLKEMVTRWIERN